MGLSLNTDKDTTVISFRSFFISINGFHYVENLPPQSYVWTRKFVVSFSRLDDQTAVSLVNGCTHDHVLSGYFRITHYMTVRNYKE